MPELALEKRNAALRFRLRNKVEVQVHGSRVLGSEDVDLFEDFGLDHLLLPGDGDGAGAELVVEGVVFGIEAHTLHRRKLEKHDQDIQVSTHHQRRISKPKEFIQYSLSGFLLRQAPGFLLWLFKAKTNAIFLSIVDFNWPLSSPLKSHIEQVNLIEALNKHT